MTIYLLTTSNPSRAHIVIETAAAVRRHLFASAASIARIARFAARNGLTAQETSDGTVYAEPDYDQMFELSDPMNSPVNYKCWQS